MSKIISDHSKSCTTDKQVLVCDNGSYLLKAGFAGDDCPRAIIPTLVGTPREEITIPGNGQRVRYVGRCASENAHLLDATSPISDGVVVDWDAMEDVWHHMYYEELLVPPDNFPALHSEPVDNPPSCREKHIEIMFETFNVPRMALVSKSALALYREGKTTGLVVDSGYDHTNVVPVYEGYPLAHTIRSIPVGGRHVTQYLARLLSDRIDFDFPKDWRIVRKIKEELCYCSLDFERELDMFGGDMKRYKMPDGTVVEVASEVFRSPEVLFKPWLFGIESEMSGVHDIVHKAVSACKVDVRDIMYGNIVLAGGNTLFPFLPDRLENTVAQLAPPDTEIEISAPVGRKYSTWIGGSILASSHNFEGLLINRDEYDEKGPAIVHQKSII